MAYVPKPVSPNISCNSLLRHASLHMCLFMPVYIIYTYKLCARKIQRRSKSLQEKSKPFSSTFPWLKSLNMTSPIRVNSTPYLVEYSKHHGCLIPALPRQLILPLAMPRAMNKIH